MINTVFKEATWTSQCSLQRAFHRRVQTSLEQHQSMVENMNQNYEIEILFWHVPKYLHTF